MGDMYNVLNIFKFFKIFEKRAENLYEKNCFSECDEGNISSFYVFERLNIGLKFWGCQNVMKVIVPYSST